MPTAQAAALSPAEAEAESMVAAITGGAGKMGRQAHVPGVLTESDEQLYRTALQAQQKGQWAYADSMLSKLRDPLLVGHMLAQRYLSANYKPQAAELRGWLARYPELPDAQAVYGLAQRVGAASGLRSPVAPKDNVAATRYDQSIPDDFAVEATRALSAADRRRVGTAKESFRDLLREDAYDAAVAALDGPELRRAFDKIDYDEMKTVLAQSLFVTGRDEEALRWASEAAERSGDVLPEAHWVAGLALWRMGKRAESASHFEAVGNSRTVSAWLNAAGSYWAARANLVGRRPQVVNHWLQQAAANPRTFYGLLAIRSLGEAVQYSWDARPFTDQDSETLQRVPAARRAFALLQIGDRPGAEDELRRLAATAGPALARSMLALSQAADMPDLTVALGGIVSSQDGRTYDASAYPVPDWKPTSGWTIDHALMLGIARQESGLNPFAKSPSGAIGLMQLMPGTARTVGKFGKMTDPAVNLELGQRYVIKLLDDDSVRGNLIFLAAAYNVGPGNLARWQQSIRHNGDPLLFLESIPVRETRFFVQKVMTHFWTYRNRMGQDSPSLDAIASGDWPVYDGTGSKFLAVKHVKN